MTLGELVEALGGKLAQGCHALVVSGVNERERAQVTELLFAEDAVSAAQALASNAGVIVLRAGSLEAYPEGKCVVETTQPRLWYARAAKLLQPALPCAGVHSTSVVAPDAVLGEGVTIGAGAVVEQGVRIGANSRIEAGAVIGQGVQIGAGCRIDRKSTRLD